MENEEIGQQESEQEKELQEKFKPKRSIDLGRLAFGLFLVICGIYFLAKNTGLLPSSLEVKIHFTQLWPLLLVFAGLSIFSTKNKLSALIGVGLTVSILLAVGYFVFTNANFLEKYTKPEKTTPFEIARTSEGIQGFAVDLEMSGATVSISDGPFSLVKGSFSSNLSEFSVNSTSKDGWQTATIKNKGSFEKFPTKFVNRLELFLDQKTPLHFGLTSQASKIDADLSQANLSQAKFVADASVLNLSLPSKNSAVKISARTSNVSLALPKNVGIQITSISELTTGTFEGFREIQNQRNPTKIYQTENFDGEGEKIMIDFDSAVSSFKILWQK